MTKEITFTDLQRRVFSKADWASYYGPAESLDPQVEDILQGQCPFYPRKRVFETHFAFVGMPAINGAPLTVAKLLELHPADGQPKFYFNNNPWHVGQPHTDVAVLESRLYIMLREIVPGSTGKTSEQQVDMLPPQYEVSTTIAEVTKHILVCRRTGKRPNPNRLAACTERTVKTARVGAGNVSCVGRFVESGLRVDGWSGSPHDDVGVGASRIIPNLAPLRT